MRARSTILILLVLLSSTASSSPAASSAPLAVDAGDSVVAYAGAPIALAGAVAGGTPPYASTWSWDGDPARFVGGAFDTTGLSPQDVVLTYTVTDALGASASDTVRHRIGVSFVIERDIPIRAGVPDEIIGGTGLDARPVVFHVPPGIAAIDATLSWEDPTGLQDLDLRLRDPASNDATGAQGATSANPERVRVEAPAPGQWVAQVEPFANGPVTAHLRIEGFSTSVLPVVNAGGPYVVGRLDEQRLLASGEGPAGPVSLAWDLDGDGFYETPGAEVLVALPPGIHTVRVRGTDPAGYEVGAPATIDVRTADMILRFRCGNDPTTPYWAMEFTSTKGSCWIHGGHHTYFTGDARFVLRGFTGFAFTVEQQFSPPTEHETDPIGVTPLHVQVSLDGITWTEVAHGEYRFVPDVLQGDLVLATRQRVDIVAEGLAAPFRYFRLHEPLSAAQGLSGYLDHTEFNVEVDRAGTTAAPILARATRALACETDILEDIFPTHPCTFGGIDRWDAPSFWHTYVVGDGARLDRIEGTFVLAPWRLDDWTQGAPLNGAAAVTARVQTSVDGVHWTDVATIPATFGVEAAFDVALTGHEARFVRLFPEYHARFDQTADFAPNHHPKGYFVTSDLVVEGLLPTA